jgi:RHS repeat-associated protein
MLVNYEYNTWGEHLSEWFASNPYPFDNMRLELGRVLEEQPIRYRGYIYDKNTEFYYLQTRYYDPQTMRFISPDILVSTGQGVLGWNMYAYCLNNPVNMEDPGGMLPGFLKKLMSADHVGGSLYGGGSSKPKVVTSTTSSSSSGTTRATRTTTTTTTQAQTRTTTTTATTQTTTGQSSAQPKPADVTPRASELRRLPDSIIRDLGGEDYTQPLKKYAGGSGSDLHWDPSTGEVYAIPKRGGVPQHVDTIDPLW